MIPVTASMVSLVGFFEATIDILMGVDDVLEIDPV